jgi:hypothetical protein
LSKNASAGQLGTAGHQAYRQRRVTAREEVVCAHTRGGQEDAH